MEGVRRVCGRKKNRENMEGLARSIEQSISPNWLQNPVNHERILLDSTEVTNSSLPATKTSFLSSPFPSLCLYLFYCCFIISKLVMNHPSDYMNNYEDSLSSDSSNPTIKISLQPKNKPSLSLHQPSHTRSHTHKLPKNHKKPSKKDKPATNKVKAKRSVSDYLILGDTCYASKNIKEITRRLITQQHCDSTKVMKLQRLKRKQEKSIMKTQVYVQTFVQNIRIGKAINNLNRTQKMELYNLLKMEEENGMKSEQPIDYFFQCAVQKLEALTVQHQEDHPHKKRAISKWKNYKMHQLSTAKLFLDHEIQRETGCDFMEELEILEEEKFFPELKEEAQDLKFSILRHMRLQEEKEGETNAEDSGVKWVLTKLLSFITERQELQRMIYERIQAIQTAQDQLLDDDLFILFSKEAISNCENELQEEELTYIHMFNKAVFDLVNQATFSIIAQCQTNNIQDILIEIFRLAPRFERQEGEDGLMLLKIDQLVFEALLEEALWDFLEYL